MSYTEYNDLFTKAQSDGNYRIILLDIENSKQIHGDARRNATIQSLKLIKNIHIKLSELEKIFNRKILHSNPIFNNENNHRLDLNEPFHILGDSFGFTIIRGSFPDQFIYAIIKNEKEKLGIDFNYHISTAYYETDEYAQGGIQYFRGYCIQYLALEKQKRIKNI